jgi:hypothetical protein
MSAQRLLFEMAKAKLPPHARLADVVADVLQIGPDSAYRRIRAEKEVTLSELDRLCRHFDISMDMLLHYQSNSAVFRYTALGMDDGGNYLQYIKTMSGALDMVARARQKEILFTAADIPIFHFMPFPELVFFKLYVWAQAVSSSQSSYEEFTSRLDREELKGVYAAIYRNYQRIPSAEVWTPYTADDILRLMEYHLDIGSFEDRETPVLLCNQLLGMLDNIEGWAEARKKGDIEGAANLDVYLSPVSPENSFMLAKRDGVSTTSIKLFTINSIVTSNDTFCAETEKWIKSIIGKSLMLSGASARERYKFFQSMKNKVRDFKKTLDVPNQRHPHL